MKVLCTTSSFNASFPEGYEVIKNPNKRKLSEEEILNLITDTNPDAIAAGVEPLTRSVLKRGTNLKVISRCGSGLDSLDLTAAKDLGIQVFNTPDAPVIPVAELTISFILSALRNINSLDRKVRDHKWEKYQGALLHEKTVGIIGCGRIGTYVARILQAFGCEVLGYDISVTRHEICRMTDMETLFKQSDIISLHLPLDQTNYHMIGQEAFDRLKRGVIIINAARGGLIDEEILLKELESGKVKFAALDVFEEEPYGGALLSCKENTILTPHIASSAKEARKKMEEETVKNLVKGLDNYFMKSSKLK
ncbi:MAG: phosphoglycerate dehydrogenase [Bacteroidota bacterium]